MIYLDNAATTKPFADYYDSEKAFFGNSSSIYKLGVKSSSEIEKVRNLISTSLNAKNFQVYFTSTGTEANNWILFSLMYENRNGLNKKIVTSKLEHPSILNPLSFFAKLFGYEVIMVENNEQGIVSIDDLKRVLKNDVLFCSIMHVNNEIGTIQPIDEIVRECKSRNVLLHVDACQSFLKIPLNLNETSVDLLTINSHKVHGPKGVAAVVVKNNILKTPFILGGGQEQGLRSGTLNNGGIIEFGKAIKKWQEEKISSQIEENGIFLFDLISKELNQAIFNVNYNNSVKNIISLRFKGYVAKDILRKLEKKEIYVSTGSACSSNQDRPSYVLKAIGLTDKECFETLRISISALNEKSELIEFVHVLKELINEQI